MKSESNIKPTEQFKITPINSMAEIEFYDLESIIEKEVEEKGISYEFDYYRLNVPYREHLKTMIENNYDSWLEKAKETETKLELIPTSDEVLADLIKLLLDKGVIF